jgi:hypothetical protein
MARYFPSNEYDVKHSESLWMKIGSSNSDKSVRKIEIVVEFSSNSLKGALNVTSILFSSINLASVGIGILFILSKMLFISI